MVKKSERKQNHSVLFNQYLTISGHLQHKKPKEGVMGDLNFCSSNTSIEKIGQISKTYGSIVEHMSLLLKRCNMSKKMHLCLHHNLSHKLLTAGERDRKTVFLLFLDGSSLGQGQS